MHPQPSFWSVLILLLLILDPFGNIPVYIGLMRRVPPSRRVLVTLRESAIAYLVLLGFMFAGSAFLRLLGLGEPALQVAGGVIVLLVALRMIFAASEQGFGSQFEGEPLVFPLAVPLLAGPSALAAVMLLSSDPSGRQWTWVGALSGALAVAAMVLLSAERLLRLVGDAVIRAAEKLMGLIVAAVAVNMILVGLRGYFFAQGAGLGAKLAAGTS